MDAIWDDKESISRREEYQNDKTRIIVLYHKPSGQERRFTEVDRGIPGSPNWIQLPAAQDEVR